MSAVVPRSPARSGCEAFRVLERRITLFTSLPIASRDKMSLSRKVREIGKS